MLSLTRLSRHFVFSNKLLIRFLELRKSTNWVGPDSTQQATFPTKISKSKFTRFLSSSRQVIFITTNTARHPRNSHSFIDVEYVTVGNPPTRASGRSRATGPTKQQEQRQRPRARKRRFRAENNIANSLCSVTYYINTYLN